VTYDFNLWWTLILIIVMMGVLQGVCAYLSLLERKVAAYMQDRLGPNRVGPYGLLQPIVDGIKFVLKEDIIPTHVDKLFYTLAPCIALSTAYLAFAVVAFGPTSPAPDFPRLTPTATPAQRSQYEEVRGQFERNYQNSRKLGWLFPRRELSLPESPKQASEAESKFYGDFTRYYTALNDYQATPQFVIAPHLDIGIVFLFSITSLAAYGIILAGWSSNSKFSLLGALRSTAQLISYELPMGMSVVGVALLCHSINVEKIIAYQTHGNVWDGTGVWLIFLQPAAFLLFVTCIFAECNRLPFDLSEAEQELVGGYHTEYSAMKFGMFYLAEYTHMMTTSFLAVAIFLGGWHFPWIATADSTGIAATVIKFIVVAVKMSGFILFFMFIRWTLPRFRFDQLMTIAWKVMIPVALLNLVWVLVVEHAVSALDWPGWLRWLLLPLSIVTALASAVLVMQQKRGGHRIKVIRGHEAVEMTI
jgi:NADH-quinone oxidoreductase subunit H